MRLRPDILTHDYVYDYYHSVLGSASYITDLDGQLVQHIEYVPFGEIFLEERNNHWNTPYLFNSKELDEEIRYCGFVNTYKKQLKNSEQTGLYYYGARYYDPRVSQWLSVDPLAEKTLDPYGYCYQNPIKLIDPTGMGPEESDGDEPPRNNLKYFGDDTGDYYWNEKEESYDYHDKDTGEYKGQFKLDIDETHEPVGKYNISFYYYNGDESPENNQYDKSKTPYAALLMLHYLSEKGDLRSLTDESKYPGVTIYTSPHMSDAVTLGNIIFMSEDFLKVAGSELIEHEYGHFLDYKFHFNYNFSAYAVHVGLPSIGSAAGLGKFGHNHDSNPVERAADILSHAFFLKF